MTTYTEHPFAQYIRILGKGKQGARALTQTEAYQAMQMIMAGKVVPEQLGAFMMLMRVKEETHEELAGFVLAVRDSLAVPSTFPAVDLDWSSYAGKRRYLPWFLLATLLLAKNGIKVFMHGTSGHTEGRLYTDEVLPVLNIQPATTLAEVSEQLTRTNFAYMSLTHLCPKLQIMIEMRPLMGLRSPVHTLARMINPFKAPYVMQGIFHPGYSPVHQEAALLLEQPHLSVLKGEGGEIERNPDLECLVQSVHNGELSDELWPPLFSQRHVKDDTMNPQRLAEVWHGQAEDEFGEGSVIATTAVTLKTLGKVSSIDEAQQMARQMWADRLKT